MSYPWANQPADHAERLAEFTAAMREAFLERPAFAVEASPAEWHAALAMLQLALRHPDIGRAPYAGHAARKVARAHRARAGGVFAGDRPRLRRRLAGHVRRADRMRLVRYVLELLRWAVVRAAAPIDEPVAASPRPPGIPQGADGASWEQACLQQVAEQHYVAQHPELCPPAAAHLAVLEAGRPRPITTEELRRLAREAPEAFQKIADWQQWVRSRPSAAAHRSRLYHRSSN